MSKWPKIVADFRGEKATMIFCASCGWEGRQKDPGEGSICDQRDEGGTMKDGIRVVSVPVLDTGIGRAAGFESDANLIAYEEARRAAMSLEERALFDEIDRKADQVFLYGEGTDA